MKTSAWTLIVAMVSWGVDAHQWLPFALQAPNAFAETVQQGDSKTNTNTNTSTNTSTRSAGVTTGSSTSTSTNCHSGGGTYGGGSFEMCNRNDDQTQKDSQNDNKDNNDNGAGQSSMLGMAAIAAGMAMVAAGIALLKPPTVPAGVALIASGMALIASGMAALSAAAEMKKNANLSDKYAANLDNLNGLNTRISTSDLSGITNFETTVDSDTKNAGGPGKGSGPNKMDNPGMIGGGKKGSGSTNGGTSTGIQIDPALTRTGRMDAIYSDMEKKTGIDRNDLIAAIESGKSPLELLSGSPALKGNKNASEENLQKMLGDSTANGLPSNSEMMKQLGLTPEDLAAAAKNSALSATGDANSYGNGGGADGASRAPAGAAANPSLDALFGAKENGALPGGGDGVAKPGGDLGLSPEVQAAFNQHGITGRTIFDMVHTQYVKKTPLMFGVQDKKGLPTGENPFAGLTGDKMEL